MRICYLCADLGIPLDGHKGASAHLRSLVRALAGLGHELIVLTPGAGPGSETALGVRIVPIRVPWIVDAVRAARDRRVGRALGHLWTNVAVERALRDVLPAFRPDVVYERYSPFAAAGGLVAHELEIPHVLEVNAPLAWEGARYRRQALQEAAETLEQAAFTSASLIIAVSREVRDTLAAAGVDAARIAVVPNGVDADLFAPHGETAPRPRPDAIVVGFVGSLKPWHGVELLVDAFRRVARDPRLHLLVVGDGPMAAAVDALAAEFPGRVTRTGAVPHAEVPRYLRAMDIAVAPYPALDRFYYSPLKLFEYLAAGRAVVATAAGQVAELVRHGETGRLVAPDDVPALADAISELAGDAALRRALGAAAAAEARRSHLWTHRARTIVDLIDVMDPWHPRWTRAEAGSRLAG